MNQSNLNQVLISMISSVVFRLLNFHRSSFLIDVSTKISESFRRGSKTTLEKIFNGKLSFFMH